MTNATITKEYTNANNGGKERVTRDENGNFYVNSCHPNPAIGWMGNIKVSRADVERGMAYTNAPASVVDAILG